MSPAILTALVAAGLGAAPVAKDYPIAPVPFTDVKIHDGFWRSRIETNRKVTVRYCFKQCEDTQRIANFAVAGKLQPGKFEGIFFNDSDVYKVIEGAAYSLALQSDPELDQYLDGLIAKIAAAQEPDGYLYTARTIDPANPPKGSGPQRWSNLAHSHELYNVGHMYEAAVAHHLATGKRSLLDVAIKNAELIDKTFGPDKKHDVPGHEEIEIGLVKLYRLTGEERYLKLAQFFIDERGHDCGRPLYGTYAQDHKPVVQQDKVVGHAVRALYLYSGMTDVAAITGQNAYVKALDMIWDNIAGCNQYITGGVGGRAEGEAFGADYELPNGEAYCETCAAVAEILWNQRMFLLKGDGKYLDVLERVLYNGFLSGVSMTGDRFFYVNPLASDGRQERQGWFDCACCPPNVVRLMPSLPGYVYAVKGDDIYVNHFVAGTAAIKTKNNIVKITQKTDYPWDGKVTISVASGAKSPFKLAVRLPGWAQNQVWPTDLYQFQAKSVEAIAVPTSGGVAAPLPAPLGAFGYQVDPGAERAFELTFPMPVRRVVADEKVKPNRGRVCVMRGPIVYCAEAIDNGGRALDLVLPDDAEFTAEHRPDLLGGVTVIKAKGQRAVKGSEGQTKLEPAEITLIPYCAWAHRGKGEMAVWLPRDVTVLTAPPAK